MTTATATGRRCFYCGTTVPGDKFTSLPDENGTPRSIHVPVVAVDGKSVDLTPGCRKGFEDRVAAVQRQRVREKQEDMALSALRREGGLKPSLLGPEQKALVESIQQKRSPRESSPREIFDCSVGDCPRFFDSEAGRNGHLKGHKTK